MVVLPLRRHSGAMTIAAYLTGLRWVDEPVLAAGQLRQGRGILDFLRPRRCRQLPRIKPGVRAAFPRDEAQLADLAQGPASTAATMRIRDLRFPVSRPSVKTDWDTDELIALLGGLPPLQAPKEPAWAAFSL